eukprot:CAMPEP_0117053320 /NCGR_PEP_ID=MMETSP0472-20121206/36864_1 /TAXON_ID=693140 ORGANISM="Tiarina fusus, Strain LIS" /NCGR_SAMPLE_ID=MMETSP0472 /ASSEMBLY_ACC=CAM_ASM_000603 /LENGTH=466 /DNA_ID=CAMNT_0004768299 /DNA_START=68 /DNA_END=1465 /DNA_ORIENTATION=+
MKHAVMKNACQQKTMVSPPSCLETSCYSSSRSKTLTYESGEGAGYDRNDDAINSPRTTVGVKSSSSSSSFPLIHLRPDALTIGECLGTGGFCKVFAIKKVSSSSTSGAPGGGRIMVQGKILSRNKIAVKKVDMEDHASSEKEKKKSDRQLTSCARDLRTEGELLSRLSHKHVVSIYAWSFPPGTTHKSKEGEDEDEEVSTNQQQQQSPAPSYSYYYSCFLLLERLDCTLKQKMLLWRQNLGYFQSTRKVIISRRCRMVLELAEALQHVHKCGIVHRDLKPGNIGFRKGVLKLFDFGVGRALPPTRGSHQKNEENETTLMLDDDELLYHMTGMVGTRRYMSPECGRGDPYNCKTDVYSFALLCYEILSLQKPYSHIDTPETISERVCHHGERPNMVLLASTAQCSSFKWPLALQQIIERLWHEDIRERPDMKESKVLLTEALPMLWKQQGTSSCSAHAKKTRGGGIW